MVEQLYPDLYRIPVPLVGPLKELNAYLITGSKRHLLIDSGFNMPRSREALTATVAEIGVSFADMDFFITHMHADHCGLTGLLACPGSHIFASKIDGEHINRTANGLDYWKTNLQAMLHCGMTQDMLDALLGKHPGHIYGPIAMTYDYLREGDMLHYGSFSLKVLELPGHSRGMLCLYDAKRRLLFSSDHILGDITPNVARPRDGNDSLGDYLASLDKADTLDMELALPGHRRRIEDPHGRIETLRRHHAARMQEIRDILGDRELNPLEIASEMTWSMRGLSWEEFPPPQKHFACCEAHAHLVHMAALGEVDCTMKNGIYMFRKH